MHFSCIHIFLEKATIGSLDVQGVLKILPDPFICKCPIETRDNLAHSDITVQVYSTMRTQ